MNVLDIIYAAAILIALVSGYMTGLLKKVSFLLGVLFGLFNTTVLMPGACELLAKHLDWDETAISVTAFIALMVLSIIAIKLAVNVLTWFLDLLGLNFINKIAGAILSAFIAMLIVTAVVDISALLAPDNKITGKTTQEKSVLYNKVVTDIYKKTITRLF